MQHFKTSPLILLELLYDFVLLELGKGLSLTNSRAFIVHVQTLYICVVLMYKKYVCIYIDICICDMIIHTCVCAHI